jgi:hypothetical protein
MAIFSSGSRFRFGRASSFRGQTVILPELINYSVIQTLTVYTIPLSAEYRIDLISLANYGRADLGWFIMGYNKIRDVAVLKRRAKLNIPDPTGVL